MCARAGMRNVNPSDLRDSVGAEMLRDGVGLENEAAVVGGNLPHCEVNTDGQISM